MTTINEESVMKEVQDSEYAFGVELQKVREEVYKAKTPDEAVQVGYKLGYGKGFSDGLNQGFADGVRKEQERQQA